MFERYTDRARRVVVLAQEEARMLGHDYLGTEHLLLGLIHEGRGIAAQALRALGVSLHEARTRTEAIAGRGDTGREPSGHIPFTRRAKKVLELAQREARELGYQYVGPEHILLGLTRKGDGAGAKVLLASGVDFGRLRQRIVGLMNDDVTRPSSWEGDADDLASRLASFAARLAAIERRLRGTGLRDR